MPLNFPTPNLGDPTTLTHTVAGITWTWNTTKNVWSSDISPAADGAEVGSLQTVTDNGAVTTNVCEFQAGVNVTGGTQADSVICGTSSGALILNNTNRITVTGPNDTIGISCVIQDVEKTQAQAKSFQVQSSSQNHTGSTYVGIMHSYKSDPGTSNVYAFRDSVNSSVSFSGSTTYTSYYTNVNPTNTGGKVYGFANTGWADNFFQGKLFIRDNVTFSNGTDSTNGAYFNSNTAGDSDLRFSVSNTSGDPSTTARYYLRFFRGQSDVANSSQMIGYVRADDLTTMTYSAGNGGSFNNTSDYRVKQNVADLSSSINIIKALRPISFEYIDGNPKTHLGFLAHELQEHVPIAVSGTKDGTEEIGTIADYDGKVLETEVPIPAELEYTEEVETDGVATMVTRTRSWTPSGTRPVYQGVDQTKLIPLLTKALQETMEKLEAAEARLDAAGL